jgi:hypothetical protein
VGASAYALAAALKKTINSQVDSFSVASDLSALTPRNFTNLRGIVIESGESRFVTLIRIFFLRQKLYVLFFFRILGGVHFRKAVKDGNNLGYKVRFDNYQSEIKIYLCC